MDTLNSALSQKELLQQLRHIGIKEGMILEVHSSFSKVGFVVGGASSLVDALIQAVGETGTLVMPSQDRNNTEPLFWQDPPIQVKLMDKIRENTPGYDIYTSGLHQMGIVADDLRSRKNTYHSYHPNSAFMAYGKDAKALMSSHSLSFPFSTNSPLGKMYNNENSYILLIGCDYDRATGLHLGESLSAVRNIVLQGGAVKKAGESVWKKYLDYDLDCSEFIEIGKAMEKAKLVRVGKLGEANVKLLPFKECVDFTKQYLQEKYQ